MACESYHIIKKGTGSRQSEKKGEPQKKKYEPSIMRPNLMFFLPRGAPQALTELSFILDSNRLDYLVPLLHVTAVCHILPLKTALPHRGGPKGHFYTI